MHASTRYPGLDVVRAIAIIWVMFFHVVWFRYGTPILPVSKLGWMGVDLFFALSGYLIGSQLLKVYAEGRIPSFVQFYRRRAFRILPAYFTVLLLYFTIPPFNPDKTMQPLWQFLTFTQNLYYGQEHSRGFGHSWSLCVEEHFYLLFPLIAWILFRNGSLKKTILVCSSLLIGGMVIRGYLWAFVVFPGTALSAPVQFTPVWQELLYFPTYVRLDGIMAGVCVAAIRCFKPMLWKSMIERPHIVLVSGVCIVASAVYIFSPPNFGFVAGIFMYPMIAIGLALVVASAASPSSLLAKVSFPGVQVVALMAYSTYLMHKQVWHLAKTYTPALVGGSDLQKLIVLSALGLAGGALLYFSVERPFLRLRDRLEQEPQTSPVREPVAA